MILLQIQWENIFLSTCKHWQAKCGLFLGICWYSCFIYLENCIFRNCRKARRHFEPHSKTVNIQGYSKLRETIRMRKNCYPLIWWILMRVTLPLTFNPANHFSGERGPLRGVTYVSSLNFKTCRFTYWGGSLVAVGILLMYLHFCCCNSFKPSLSCLFPFLLFYITVSRPCCLSKIIP